MKFGICTGIDCAGEAKAAGFDYFEPTFSSLAGFTMGQIRGYGGQMEDLGIKAEAMNVMLPGTLRLTGPEADLKPVEEYLKDAFAKAALLGLRVVVFGSGGARKIPVGFPYEKAMEQLSAFLRLAGGYARDVGVEIAIEPLNRGETNCIHTVGEARQLCAMAGQPNVGVLADWYHVLLEGDSFASSPAYGTPLLHTHISRANRMWPQPGDGEDYSPFVNALKRLGYNARVSVEGREEGTMAGARRALAALFIGEGI